MLFSLILGHRYKKSLTNILEFRPFHLNKGKSWEINKKQNSLIKQVEFAMFTFILLGNLNTNISKPVLSIHNFVYILLKLCCAAQIKV